MNIQFTSKRSSSSLAPILLTCGLSAVGHAAEGDRSDVLEEVVVTTQKRSESLQEVPLAISGYTAEVLERQNVSDLQDLQGRVPSLVYYGNPGQRQYYIRGMGNDVRGGAVNSDVGVFLDGIYLDNAVMTYIDFVDMDRIEVLRGPQGTLFGRNVVGGAISYHTRKPAAERRMGLELTYGNHDQREARGYLSGGITDSLFGGIAATTRDRDGYAFNTTTNRDVEAEEYDAARTALRYAPSESIDVQLNLDASRRRGDGGWSILYKRGALPTAQPELSSPWRGAHYWDDGYLNFDNEGASLSVDWQTGIGTFTSLTGYRTSERASRTNGTPPNIPASLRNADVVGQLSNILYILGYNEDTRQVSQEFRLASADAERLKWVLGVYYFHNEDDFNPTLDYNFLPYRTAGSSGSIQNSQTDAYAAFANVSYDILDNLTAQAGVRWSRDKKTASTTAYGINYVPWTTNGVPTPLGYQVSGSADWSAVTPAFSLNYQIVPDAFLYATVSKGFKSGGFYAPLQEATAAATPVGPEYAWNYELGAKTEWLDHRLRLNVSAFWVDYSDLQVNAIKPLGSGVLNARYIVNAGQTTSKGVESEFNVILAPGANLYGSYTYMKTRINQSNSAGALTLRVGDELVKAPRHKAFVGASYEIPLGSWMTATARVDYSYISGYYSSLPNNPIDHTTPGRNLGAGLLLETQDGHWSVELWGRNLTDEVHASSITNIQGFGVYAALDPPRTYGVTVNYKN